MLCPVCEGQQLHEDEVTGQIICSECGAATGVFQNHTFSQQFATLRGLRAAAVTDDLRPASSQDKPAHCQYAIGALVSRSELLDSLSNVAVKLENEDMTQQFVETSGLLGPSEQSGGNLKKRLDLVYRPWRLSEPLTYLMRRQTEQLSGLLQLAPAWRSRLEDAVWRLWLTYLAVTGELGEAAWLAASRRSARSAASLLRLCDTVHGLALTKTTSSGGGPGRPGRPKLRAVCCEQRKLTASNTLIGCNCQSQSVPADKVKQMGWLLVQNRLAHFLWAGWGGLYEPCEGQQTRYLPFIGLVDRDDSSPRMTAKTSIRRRRSGERRQSQSSESEIRNAETASEVVDQQDEDEEDGTPSKCHRLRKRRKRTRGDSELLYSSQDVEDQELADAEFDPVSGGGDHPMPSEFSKADLVTLLLEPEPAARRDGVVDGEGASPPADAKADGLDHRLSAWKTYLTCKLAEQGNTWQRLFWHGQLNGQTRQLTLVLEHNLAILFLAYLSAAPARRALNPLPWQVHQAAPGSAPSDPSGGVVGPHHQSVGPSGLLAVSHMITIRDICEMCTKRQLAFFSADGHFPPGVYSIFDQFLLRRLNRKQPPSVSTLARVTMQLLHMTGIYHLPKFPLAWLAHRHVIAFGLPDIVFRVVRVLIRRLHLQLTHSVDKLALPSLLCSVPWSRALRPEVFAMALVIVALRLTFKLDDVTEYRLSQLARLLNRRKCLSRRSREQTPPVSALHFDWIAWAVHLSDRFNSDAVSLTTTTTKTTAPDADVSAAGRRDGTDSPLGCSGVAASATDTTSSSVDCLTKMVSAPQKPAIMAASRIGDLLNVHRTTDFLGSHEFQVDKDVGWGENSMQKRIFSSRNVKAALTRPLRNCYAQANGRTGGSPAASHHDNDNVNPPGHQRSAASPKCPPLATRLSRFEQEGWDSPFRSAQLWYLTDSTATTTDHLPIPCASVSGRGKKKHERIPAASLADWADQFWRQQRSAYQPVCQGPWAYGSVESMAAKDRKRVGLPRRLPEQLLRLLHRHSQFLADGMLPDDVVPFTEEQEEAEPVLNGHCEETDDAAAEGAERRAPDPKASPSQSLQWLLRLAVIICGASGVRHLVLELNTVEHLLGLAVHKHVSNGRVRLLNLSSLAIASCFDLNDHLPSVDEHFLSVSTEVKCEEQPGASERRSR